MSIVPSEVTGGVLLSTPIGPLTLIFSPAGLSRIKFGSNLDCKLAGRRFDEAAEELDAYFSGEEISFTVRLDPHGTAFQERVWSLLDTIPYGETCSYGQLAQRLGNMNLARAVGSANSCNPIPIIRPCHRVIGASGHLTGYRGGLDRKQTLLQLEAKSTKTDLFNHFGET